MSPSANPAIAPPDPTRAVGCLLGGAAVEFATLSAIRALATEAVGA